ncbi:MAG: HipA domain-containing protein [Bacilli bacterium]|nr:HipA domain-containing protein [Bacilli bacterium]
MRKEGFILLDDYVDSRMLRDYMFFSFNYNDSKCFFKFDKSQYDVYNELIAEEFAKDYGIDCAHYDLGFFHGFRGVISKNFIKPGEMFYTGYNLMEKVFNNNEDKLFNSVDYNNLDFYKEHLNEELFEELINVFIFDVLTGNCDRHENNIGFIKDDFGIRLSPVYDNEKVLSDTSINHGFYRLSVSKDDDLKNFFLDPLRYNNIFRKFILKYKRSELVREKLEIISNKNIDNILCRVEDRIDYFLPDKKKNDTKKLLLKNKKKIEKDL